jgi:16S rRNA (cytidine1402-2'-O)-methyltransferase
MGHGVIPHIGPSSILLALMASGLEGQRFSFHGYLPIDDKARLDALLTLEKESRRARASQLFIEPPYRNDVLRAALLKALHPSTWLTVAVHLTGKEASIKTRRIKDWRALAEPLEKRPTLFAILAA